ncbi:MAG: prepilin-type N-terminal cleavage/methylation domain-containing protein, partial [Phycisphaerae bacterium]|nr:prepilin-type N-terminal cleavage/methylation domain-containing protein [Phycisphaerae bacterium]
YGARPLQERDCHVGRRRPFLRGFTLLELVMVVAIVAILASVALPRFANTLGRHRIEAAARRVAGDLNLARRQARLSSSDQNVVFDVSAESYQLPGLADLDHPTTGYEVQLDEQPYEVEILSAVFDADAEIIFDGYGIPDSGGSVVLVGGGYQITISVDAESGLASTQSGGATFDGM